MGWPRSVGWKTALVGLLLASAVVLATGAWLGRRVMVDPQWRSWAVDHVLDGTGVTLRMGALEVEPDSWTVHVDDVFVESARGRLTAAEARTEVPGLWSVLLLGRVELGRGEVSGLEVTGVRGLPRAASSGPQVTLVMDRLRIRDAKVRLPSVEAAQLPPAEFSGIDVDLSGVRLKLGLGLVRGQGELSIERWQTGGVRASQVLFDDVSVAGDTIHLDDGRFSFAKGAGAGRVEITQRSGRAPLIHADLQVKQVRLEHLIGLATGAESPLTGRLSGEVDVRAGEVPGQLGATTRLDARLEDGALALGPGVSGALKRALKVAPFLKVRSGQVLLGPTSARLELRPGRVEVEQLIHESAGRNLAAKGSLQGDELDLVVRLVPKRRADERAGFGIVVTGPAGGLDVRRATADELRGVGQ